MAYLWWWHLVLVVHKLSNLLVESVSLLGFLFLDNFSEFTSIKLGVVIGFSALHSDEGIQKVIILDHGGLTVAYLAHSDGFGELLSDDCVSLDHDNQLFLD